MSRSRWRLPTSDIRVALLWSVLFTALAVATGLALRWYPGHTVVDCDACVCSDKATPK